ncbi:XRE family transcriptional regulator [Lactococcus lactis]|uniref:XRE family transcriptional regulator n=1 Tax=Lactococcus lactis TaxID=1358 RepID=UPI001911B0D2|nr:helix-turn-helix domain-containing protein [Lactococcus lactis]WDA67546.1 helix-turn-helix domain-containing protein [Lactococcus lactis]
MEFSKRLKELRKENGYTQKSISEMLGIKQPPYQRWESGKSMPTAANLELLAKTFNVSVSYLLGETDVRDSYEIVEIMEQLNKPRQKETIDFAKNKLIEQNEENKIIILNNSLVPYEVEEEQALSAGYGEGYTQEYGKEIVYWNQQVKHDRAIIIRGNSMEPDYHYGQIALIRYQNCVDVPGGIYAVDDIEKGLAYIKSVYVEDEFIRLVSLNDEENFEGNRLFPDILLPRNENTRIIGKVVAAFTPIEKEY